LDLIKQMLPSRDERFREGFLNLAPPIVRNLKTPAKFLMCLLDFVENSVTPQRKEERRLLGEPQQQIAHVDVRQDVGVHHNPGFRASHQEEAYSAGSSSTPAAVSLSVSRLRIADRLAGFSGIEGSSANLERMDKVTSSKRAPDRPQ